MLLYITKQNLTPSQSVRPSVSFTSAKAARRVVNSKLMALVDKDMIDEFVNKYDFKKKKPVQWAIKRSSDYVWGFLGLLVSSPIIVVSAAAIKIESKGPVMYKQIRVGEKGKAFPIYKLRTMYYNSPSGPLVAPKTDPRITKVGKILRKFSIDEFPQFYNIAKGDMSFVGPRPTQERELIYAMELDPSAIKRVAVKPGTVLPYGDLKVDEIETAIATKNKIEEEYLENWSLKNDMKIMAGTFKRVVTGKNR